MPTPFRPPAKTVSPALTVMPESVDAARLSPRSPGAMLIALDKHADAVPPSPRWCAGAMIRTNPPSDASDRSDSAPLPYTGHAPDAPATPALQLMDANILTMSLGFRSREQPLNSPVVEIGEWLLIKLGGVHVDHARQER